MELLAVLVSGCAFGISVLTLIMIKGNRGMLQHGEAWEALHEDQKHIAHLLENMATVAGALSTGLDKVTDAITETLARIHADHEREKELLEQIDRHVKVLMQHKPGGCNSSSNKDGI